MNLTNHFLIAMPSLGDPNFKGTVTYMWFEIAELTGDIEGDRGVGEWRALKGPDCEGEFSVRKLNGSPQKAQR